MRNKILKTATAAAVLSVFLPVAPHCPIGPQAVLAEDDDPEVTRMAKEHYKLGLDAFNAGKFDQAIKELKKAYMLKRLPAILLNIGLSYRKTKDFDMALYFYKKYLQEAPAEDKGRPAAESALGEIEAERAAAKAPQAPAAKPAVEAAQPKPAVTPAAPSGPAAKPAVEAAAPAAPGATPGAAPAAPGDATPGEWSHTAIDAVPPNAAVDVRVQTPVMKGVKVKIFFRKEGQASWDQLELKRRGPEKLARLPASVTSGRTFQYYIEARDQAGTLIKSSGSEASPNIVLIDATARQQVAGEAEGPDDEELAKKGPKGFSRDIENEAATFDLAKQAKSMERLRAQQQSYEKPGKPKLGTLGWIGVGLLGGGVAAGGTSLAFYGLMKQNESDVVSDSMCVTKVKINGVLDCPAYNGKGSLKPSTMSLEQTGQTYNTVWTALGIASLPLMVGGATLIAYDVLKRQAAERAATAPPKPKKKKVKKVIEVEEPAALLYPMVSPTTAGMALELTF